MTEGVPDGVLRLSAFGSRLPFQGWLPVVRLSDLADGAVVSVDVLGHPLALIRRGADVRALDGRCPHRGGPLDEGMVDAGVIRCPWHGFEYDVETGESVWPGGWQPATVYQARVTDGSVEVQVNIS